MNVDKDFNLHACTHDGIDVNRSEVYDKEAKQAIQLGAWICHAVD